MVLVGLASSGGLAAAVPLLRGAAEESRRLQLVLRHAFAVLIESAEVALSYRVALGGSLAEQPRRLALVLRHALAMFVQLGRQFKKIRSFVV